MSRARIASIAAPSTRRARLFRSRALDAALDASIVAIPRREGVPPRRSATPARARARTPCAVDAPSRPRASARREDDANAR
jgi:hypothetical protein